ncbi:hypothetical protein [Pseudarthrobacter sulfonivorans]|uniref:hypothetical protein n=1 Tax=Pseudarthrobacter sulfonivorans TaxID=121292 RepID=UPI0021041510|nr:hypothetical protein [Pseudarthrobacter sulfonivorans]
MGLSPGLDVHSLRRSYVTPLIESFMAKKSPHRSPKLLRSGRDGDAVVMQVMDGSHAAASPGSGSAASPPRRPAPDRQGGFENMMRLFQAGRLR